MPRMLAAGVNWPNSVAVTFRHMPVPHALQYVCFLCTKYFHILKDLKRNRLR
jgi:hypothetical protein